jgi:hypothetical protein
MVLGWWFARRAQSTNTPPVTTDQSVRDAEEIVRRAWGLELLRQRDHLQFALRAAEHDCDIAHAILAAAQRNGDAHGIAAAHETLEQALEAARRSAVACERIRQALRAELELLANAGNTRMATAAVRRLEHDGSMLTTEPPPARGVLTRGVRRVLVVLPSERGVSRWLRRLVMRRATALGQP